MTRVRLIILASVLVGLFTASVSSSYAVEFSASDIGLMEAVYIERFARFVQWPDDSLAQNDSLRPFSIGVLNAPDFARQLRTVYATALIRGRKVVIEERSGDTIPSCRVLFIGSIDQSLIKTVIAAARRSKMLIISSTPGFGRRGIHINFFVNNMDQLRFEINKESLSAAGLKISHLLLNVARIVSTTGDVGP